jgi:hypothetical protein
MYLFSNAPISKIRCLMMMTTAIDAAHNPYDALWGPNSNSAISAALQYCGLPNGLSPGAVAAGHPVSYTPLPY